MTPPRTSRWHPSLPAVVFLLWGLLIPVFESDAMVNADGDPARHIRHGETILAQGGVIQADPFSFTRAGEPFVGFEYGTQVLLALGHRAGGLAGLVALSTLVIALTLALLTAWLIRRGADPLLAVATSTLVAVLTNIHWLARPHIFSWPLVLVLLALLERDRPPPVWPVVFLFALWSNLHGGFVYGWLLIGMYLVGHLVTAWSAADAGPRAQARGRARRLGLLLPLAVAATAVNPYGWQLPWHVVEFFRDAPLRDLTHEFLSPDFHAPDLLPFLATVLGVLVLFARGLRPSWPHLIVVAGNLAMALVSQRNIIFFALTAVPLLALDLASAWERRVGGRPFAQRFAASARSGVTIPYALVVLLALGGLTLARGTVGGLQVVREGFNPARFPVDIVREARRDRLEGRLFHEFVWGGYLLHAWPEQRVFIDGGSDFYGGAHLESHRAVIGLVPGWRDSLLAWEIDRALLRSDGPLASELAREPGWQVWGCDSTAALLTRPPLRPEPRRGAGCGLR